ncbi:acetylxylan esterase [Streptomyces sp. NPDC001393]
MYTDLPEAELRRCPSNQIEPDDDASWDETLTEARPCRGKVRLTPVSTGLSTANTFDVTFPGFGGEPVKAWLRLPGTATGPLPAIGAVRRSWRRKGHVWRTCSGRRRARPPSGGHAPPGLGLEPGATPASGPTGPEAGWTASILTESP